MLQLQFVVCLFEFNDDGLVLLFAVAKLSLDFVASHVRVTHFAFGLCVWANSVVIIRIFLGVKCLTAAKSTLARHLDSALLQMSTCCQLIIAERLFAMITDQLELAEQRSELPVGILNVNVLATIRTRLVSFIPFLNAL